jgi:hypothetical protein
MLVFPISIVYNNYMEFFSASASGDYRVFFGDFSATTVKVEALTSKAREILAQVSGIESASSIEVRKSFFQELRDRLILAGCKEAI